MQTNIVLSREKKYWCYGPGDKVEGKVVIHNLQPVYCSGIQVTLETIVRVNFKDSDSRLVTKVENALPNIFTYIWPVNWSWAQITGKLDDSNSNLCLPASKHIFPFSFSYPSSSHALPGSFCSEFGSVKHQLVVYLKTTAGPLSPFSSSTNSGTSAPQGPSALTPPTFHRLTSLLLNFRDYLNLLQDPTLLKPLVLEKRKKSLMFSLVHPNSRSPLSFTLKLNQRAYLPGEYAPFNLTVCNLTGKSLAKIVVSIIQKVSYHAEKVKKTLGTILDETDTQEADMAVETIWESGFHIPQGVKPTFYKGAIEHQYFIKVQIFSKGNPTRASLKGHVPLIIGTNRDPEGQGQGSCIRCREGQAHHLHNHSNSLAYLDSGRRGRRTSLDLPRGSMTRLEGYETPGTGSNVVSPPPSYSQLSSRATSVDNFLPLYEDAMVSHSYCNHGAGTSRGGLTGPRKKSDDLKGFPKS